MKKQHIFAALIVVISYGSGLAGGKAMATDCLPIPCGNTCQSNSLGTYFCEKSIFDLPLFENQYVGKKSRSRISFYGWMLTGVTINNHGSTTWYGPNVSAYDYNNRRAKNGTIIRNGYNDRSGNTHVLMIEQPTDWKVNQLWFGAKRDLDNHFGCGFQSDFVYGTDLRYARNWGDQSFDNSWGSGDYFASFAQLYGTVGTRDMFVKVGKFAGGFAYEGLAASREYFYTHANIAYGRPLTTQGVMVEWHPNKKLMLTGGWTAGVFNSFENPFGDNGFLGKATYQLSRNTSLSYRIFYNDKGYRNDDNRSSIDSINTLIFTWNINKHWFYMGEIAYADGKVYGDNGKIASDAWGINNHLIRTFTDKFSVGFRGEYHHSHGSTFDRPAVSGGRGGDLWEFTLAAHYKVNPKTTIRPEIRYDYVDYDNGYRPFGGDESKDDQLCGGVSFIVLF